MLYGFVLKFFNLAEEGGFEPPVVVTPHTLSKRAH